MPFGKCSSVREAAVASWVFFPKGSASGLGIIASWHSDQDEHFLIEVETKFALINNYKGMVYCVSQPVVEPTLSTFRQSSVIPSGGLACSGDSHFLSFELSNGDKYFLDLKRGIEKQLGANLGWFSQWGLYNEIAGKFEELLSVKL